jgi:hypothetical protein
MTRNKITKNEKINWKVSLSSIAKYGNESSLLSKRQSLNTLVTSSFNTICAILNLINFKLIF